MTLTQTNIYIYFFFHYTASPDDEVFRDLASAYSEAHLKMSDPNRKLCDGDLGPVFEDGITNGAAWYPLRGGRPLTMTDHHRT